MALQKLKYVTLHSPLFLVMDKSGINLKEKLDPRQREGLELFRDPEQRLLIVRYQNEEAILPESSAFAWHEGEWPKKPALKTVDVPQGKIKAQVEGPQSHVFDGLGKGKTK
jgi:hypothetical protein